MGESRSGNLNIKVQKSQLHNFQFIVFIQLKNDNDANPWIQIRTSTFKMLGTRFLVEFLISTIFKFPTLKGLRGFPGFISACALVRINLIILRG